MIEQTPDRKKNGILRISHGMNEKLKESAFSISTLGGYQSRVVDLEQENRRVN
jgi:hypothetical protein